MLDIAVVMKLPASINHDRDYVLGTHDEELARLGLQHRVWRPVVLDCWHRAGVTVGKRVLDVGAGPGYATVDLAEIVGPTGEVIALERSQNFVRAMEAACRARSVNNVKIHEIDLMTDDLPAVDYDFAWCRWVVSFVSDPVLLIRKLARVMPKGSLSIFHEYGHYETWRFLPRLPMQERFREHVIATWRESGGEPDGTADYRSCLQTMGLQFGRPGHTSFASDRATICGNGLRLSLKFIFLVSFKWGALIRVSPTRCGLLWRTQRRIPTR